jgi:hypothetical protein
LNTQVQTPRQADLKSDLLFLSKPICNQYDLKFRGEEQSVDQSTENTRSDKPSNLIPHDKDHAGDPMCFVPIFHNESTQIEIFQQCEERHLKKTNESSKQRDEDHHASNLSLIILDEHKNLHSNIFDKHGSAVSPEG